MESILVNSTYIFEKIKKMDFLDVQDNVFIDFNGLPEFEKQLFFLYEYSDDSLLMDEGGQYPSILNYVKTGILTEEEIIKALLHK